jgi:hypothetical protein
MTDNCSTAEGIASRVGGLLDSVGTGSLVDSAAAATEQQPCMRLRSSHPGHTSPREDPGVSRAGRAVSQLMAWNRILHALTAVFSALTDVCGVLLIDQRRHEAPDW